MNAVNNLEVSFFRLTNNTSRLFYKNVTFAQTLPLWQSLLEETGSRTPHVSKDGFLSVDGASVSFTDEEDGFV